MQQSNKEFKKKYPNVESFKTFCFSEAEKDQNLDDCIDTKGWCAICLRMDAWDK